MAVLLSTQQTALAASPRKFVKANEFGGRVRRVYFDYTVPTGNAAVGDYVEMFPVPTGARILGGFLAWEAMSTAGGDASVQIGISGTDAKYLGTVSVDAAGTSLFANTIALKYGEELAAEAVLRLKVVTEAWLAAKVIQGHIDYMVD